jgi:septum formation protein
VITLKPIILASGSPRRNELLSLLDIPFEVCASKVEEVVDETSLPEDIVMSLALQKAHDVARNMKDAIVLGADTVVVIDGQVLGKPENRQDAAATLRRLSGRTHEVFTGVAIVSREKATTFYERTEVTFYELTEEDITAYLQTGEPFDKAGSYGIQGRGAVLVRKIAGDYYSVVGLPIARVARELQRFFI